METTYGDLFDFVEEKCNFRITHVGKTVWTCYKDLRFTKEFCEKNKVDFDKVKEALESTGGFCDCEVVFNSSDKIATNRELPSVGEN